MQLNEKSTFFSKIYVILSILVLNIKVIIILIIIISVQNKQEKEKRNKFPTLTNNFIHKYNAISTIV